MGTFLAVIGFLGFIVFIVMAIMSAIRKTGKGKKRMLYAAGCFVLMIIGGAISPDAKEPASTSASTTVKSENKANDSTKQNAADEAKKKEEEQKKAKEEAEAKKKAEEEAANKKAQEEAAAKKKNEEENSGSTELGKDAVVALESNDFMKFTEEYKKLGKDKTPVWDKQLSGKKVTWTGTVVDAGSSQLFLYGSNDYKGETWSQLGDAKKLYYSFVAKYADPKQFKELKTGDIVTVEGDLDSRGDFDLNYNWKIYNATLKSKQ